MSIQLGGTGLAVVLPDGTPLFSDLQFHFGPLRTGLVGRNGIGKSTLLRVLAGHAAPTRGQATASGRVVLLDQNAPLQSYATLADALCQADAVAAYERVLKGTGTPEDFEGLEGRWDLYDRIERALQAVGLGHLSAMHPYDRLSGGEQTRLQFARLVLEQPDFALLDEPTNHLDRVARAFVYDWVEHWSRGLVLVSHDRALLDLMDQIALLDERGLHLYGGNFSFFQEQAAAERAAAEQALQHARQALKAVQTRAQRAQERQVRRQASGRRHAQRTGIAPMAAGIMKRHAEATASKLAGKHAGKVAETEDAVRQARAALVPDRTITIDLSSTAVHSRKRMVALCAVNVRYKGTGNLWARPVTLTIAGPDRVALVGRNGSGKSTLLKLIHGALAPSEGECRIGARRTAVLDQQVQVLDPALTLLENMRRVAPERPEHEARLLLARFLFDRTAVEKPAGVLSGGERMRAGLACLLGQDQAPDLLLLDEPANNLDLQSLEEMTSVLRQFEGTLIVASHDETFLEEIRIRRILDLDAWAAAGR